MDSLKILEHILNQYLNASTIDDEQRVILTKKRVAQINGVSIHVYEDHNPPHFHIRVKDKSIDALFLIASGELHKGKVSPKNRKLIKAWFKDAKVQVMLQQTWQDLNSDKG